MQVFKSKMFFLALIFTCSFASAHHKAYSTDYLVEIEPVNKISSNDEYKKIDCVHDRVRKVKFWYKEGKISYRLQDDDSFFETILFTNISSEKELKQLMLSDPCIKSGIFSYTYKAVKTLMKSN